LRDDALVCVSRDRVFFFFFFFNFRNFEPLSLHGKNNFAKSI